VHVWRQADCVSYALNYYQNNQPFFEPQTHTLTGKNGHAVSEFPIIYFITGKLYHVLGRQHYILRGIHFFIFFSGCFALFLLCFDLFQHKWLALFPPLITFSSPYLYYYGLNFLPDVPALSLSLIAWWMMFRYFKAKNIGWLFFAFAFFALGMLLKISSGISFAALIGALLFLFFKKVQGQYAFDRKHEIYLGVSFILVAYAIIEWVQFAKYYNEANGTGQNLLGIFPLWDADRDEISYIAKRFYSEWSQVILHPVLWCWMAGLSALIIWKFKSLIKFILIITVSSIIGATAYSLLWYRAYLHHDYYMINPFVFIIWIMISAMYVADKQSNVFIRYFSGAAIIVTVVSIIHCRNVQLERYYDAKNESVKTSYFTVEPHLRNMGVLRTDKVVSVPDQSPNITLYFLNQPGWTEAFNHEQYNINYFVSQGAKYLITADTGYINNPLYGNHIDKYIGNYQDIYVYSLK